jgi:hypothetical protein
MPQFQIRFTPITAQTINTAIRRPVSTSLSLNDRFCRIFTRTGFGTPISYGSFLNVPGFEPQAGTSINVFMFSGQGARIVVPISNNFPGISAGDAFSVVVGAAEGWTDASPVTHHGYFYGSAGSLALVNGSGGKRWFSRTEYDGGNTVNIDGFYSGSDTNIFYARMYLLALRFGISQTGYAAGDGNSVVGGQTGFTINSYVSNWPQNTNIVHSTVIPPPPVVDDQPAQ